MFKKILFRTLIIISALVILLLLLLPGIVKRYSVNHSKEILGRQIELDKLKVNYFNGKISLTDFVMFEEDEKSEFIVFDTLIVNLEPFQFFFQEFVMESFYLKGLNVNVIQYDSSFNFDDLVAYHSSEEDSEDTDTTDNEPFRFQLSNIDIKQAQILFEDQNIDKITDLNDISFFVPFIGWDQEEKSEAGLRFAFKHDGYFESSINVDPIGGDYEAEITIHHLHLNTFQEYAAEYININAAEGLLNSNIHIYGNHNDVEKSLISGYAEVLDLELTDKENIKFLGAAKLECVLQTIDIANNSFMIDSILVDQPYVYFEMDTASNNLSQIFGLNSDESDSTQMDQSTALDSTTTHMPVFWAVNNFQINQGVIDYTDNLTGEPFNYYLSEIMLDSDSLKSTSDWIKLTSNMMLNKQGTLNAEVGINPANPLDINLNYVITDFQLSDLNIYSRFYMGFPIVYGDMYYKSGTEIMKGQLNSENKLVITNVELGDKKGGLYSLPIKFALFILKDREGVINLDIPVRGNLNDPRVSVGKIVWTTFKNLIVKVATSPFDALSRLLNVDPKDIESIEYEYTDTLLSAEKQKQLDLLLELEQKKEGLNIELVYFNDVEKEKYAIAVSEMGKKFTQKTTKDYIENPDEFEAFIHSQSKSDTLDLNNSCLQLVDANLIESLSESYLNSRISQIKRQLFMANDSTGILVSTSNLKAPKNSGSLPIFEVKYSIIKEEDKGSTEE